jgi:hypothetical protein
MLLTILTGYKNPVLTLLISLSYTLLSLTVVAIATIRSIHFSHCGSAPFSTYHYLPHYRIYLLYLPTIAEAHLITVNMATRQHRIEPLTEDNFDT